MGYFNSEIVGIMAKLSVRIVDQKPLTVTLVILRLTNNDTTKFDPDALYILVGASASGSCCN